MLVSVSETLASPPTIKPENPFQLKTQNQIPHYVDTNTKGMIDGEIGETYQERSAGLRKVIELFAAKDVAKDEGEDEHHDLEEDSDAGSLLLLPGRRTPPGLRGRNGKVVHGESQANRTTFKGRGSNSNDNSERWWGQ